MTGHKAGRRADQPDDLRTRAVQRAHEKTASVPKSRGALSHEETLRLIHELEVHQIELEIQNEELNRSREELEASRARYFDLYDLAPVAYFTVNGQGLILETNLAAAALLGVERGGLVRQPFSRFVLPEDRDAYQVQRVRLAERGTQHSWEMRMMRADGSSCWTNLQAALQSNGECRITLSDISERKRTEATLALAEARLQRLQKAESLERMAGAIAHHFNNKLHVVLGNLELATGDPSIVEGGADRLLKEAMQSALQAAELSTLMLTFLGQSADTRAPLDLSLACRWTLPLLQTSLQLPLETDLPSPGPIVMAHAEKIQQILVNLIANAGEAVGKGGGVVRLVLKTISSKDIPEAHRFPSGWEPRDTAYACLEVSDNGQGIADKDLDNVFDPFFSSKAVGRGLGLAVVLGIVRAHGGAVSVSGEPGRGSTFRVFLPVVVDKAPLPSKNAPEFKTGGTVLLVDDEDLVRSVAAALLRSLGFFVREATGGTEAAEVLDGHRDEIRLVVCDLTMPGMNGWETMQALRRLVPGIPVILSSGYDKLRVMTGYHPELPQTFLRKPYQLRDLRDAISLALGADATPR